LLLTQGLFILLNIWQGKTLRC